MLDPRLGRWIQEDPIGFEGGDTNFYRDVRNNPTNATDPTGLLALNNQLFADPRPLETNPTGFFSQKINWRLAKPSSNQVGGLVIQLMTGTVTAWGPQGGLLGNTTRKFYEIWKVPPRVVNVPGNDDWSGGVMNTVKVGSYEMQFQGKAWYVDACEYTPSAGRLLLQLLTAIGGRGSGLIGAISVGVWGLTTFYDNNVPASGATISAPWNPITEAQVNLVLANFPNVGPLTRNLIASWNTKMKTGPLVAYFAR